MAVALRYGAEKSAGKHIPRAVGIDRLHHGRGQQSDVYPLAPSILEGPRKADGARQLVQMRADLMQVLRATPILGLSTNALPMA